MTISHAVTVSLVCIALSGYCPITQADAITADVSRDGKRFSIEFAVNIDAPASKVFALLTDYRNLAEISPSTTYSGWVKSDLLRVEIRSCVLVFCKTMTKLSRVTQGGKGSVSYDGVKHVAPFYSSFSYSRERLSVTDAEAGRGAVVSYQADLETAFTVPVIVRAWMVRYVLIRDLKATLANVKTRIAAHAPEEHAQLIEF